MSTPVLPTLADGERFHVLPPTGLRIRDKCENRPDTMVGRLHYSLSFTLSAQFRWSVGASEVLTSLPSTSVLGSGPDYRETDLNRSIRHPTYPYTSSRDGGSTPRSLRSTFAYRLYCSAAAEWAPATRSSFNNESSRSSFRGSISSARRAREIPLR